MGRKRPSMDVVGLTSDNKKVVNGIFRLFDSTGLPLDVVFSMCEEKNIIPSWIDFYNDAIKQGWTEKTIMNRLEINIRDVYGKPYWIEVEKRLNFHINSLD